MAWETLFHLCGPKNWLMLYALSHWACGPSRLLEKMTAEARTRILPGLMDGSKSMCFGLTEAGAGSDVSMIKTRAERDGEGWRITGRKIFISNAPIADYCVVFAVTGPELAQARRGGISPNQTFDGLSCLAPELWGFHCVHLYARFDPPVQVLTAKQ